ncbi:MAG: amino acid ABC transporter permease [Dethiobacter sp.]|nr:amino acid ABC transporter permease [Dethiobacter sp.]MBS3902113.1 amino acid ABC transporter permease [Dethiobacter sp.]MBS3988397.1 amino acid ABC transporter permease [Dethiobacter sp.]
MQGLEFSIVLQNWRYLFDGAVITVQVSAFAVAAGLIIGSVVGLARVSTVRLVRAVASVYVEFIRGTPLLVQILLIWFGLPSLGIRIESRFVGGVIALSINSGAYVAEIVRSGIQSIDKGQMEAARSLGMNYTSAMRFVILPQAFRRIIPPLVNEFIMLIKDSSLLAFIGMMELTKRAQNIQARTFNYFELYLAIAVIYFMITFALSKVAGYIEGRTRIHD